MQTQFIGATWILQPIVPYYQAPAGADSILLETGDHLLLETGDLLLSE